MKLCFKLQNLTKESQYRPSFLLLDMHEGLFIPEISTYSIYDVYKIDKNSDEVEIVEFGDWNTATGLTVAEENIWKRRSNLKGHHLKYVIEYNLSIIHIFYIFILFPKMYNGYLFNKFRSH